MGARTRDDAMNGRYWPSQICLDIECDCSRRVMCKPSRGVRVWVEADGMVLTRASVLLWEADSGRDPTFMFFWLMIASPANTQCFG